MKYTIEIPEEELKEAVLKFVADEIARTYSYEGRIFKKIYGEVIKEMIYKPEIKEEIINRVVDQAASEIRRKAIPQIIEKLQEGN